MCSAWLHLFSSCAVRYILRSGHHTKFSDPLPPCVLIVILLTVLPVPCSMSSGLGFWLQRVVWSMTVLWISCSINDLHMVDKMIFNVSCRSRVFISQNSMILLFMLFFMLHGLWHIEDTQVCRLAKNNFSSRLLSSPWLSQVQRKERLSITCCVQANLQRRSLALDSQQGFRYYWCSPIFILALRY